MALDPNLRKILQTQLNEIASSVQLQHLLPILRNKDLVTDPEFESLSTSTESSYEKNRKMVTMVLQKGKNAFNLFVEALQCEEDHIGHKSLAEKLQASKKELRKPSLPSRTTFFSPPRPRTRRSSLVPRENPLRNSRPSSTGCIGNESGQDEPQKSKDVSQVQPEESKVELRVKTSRSELPMLFGTVNSNKKIENRISNLESDLKTTKQNTEETKIMLQQLTTQFGTAFEMLSNQMEKMYSQSYEVDDHDVNQVMFS